jgi:hypothetical protein
MKNKGILIGIGAFVLVGGVLLFFLSKKDSDKNDSKKSNDLDESSDDSFNDGSDDSSDDDSGTVGGTSLSRKERRQDRKATCREKYGKGKPYRQCKRRVRKGGVAFDGSTQFEYNDVLTDI